MPTSPILLRLCIKPKLLEKYRKEVLLKLSRICRFCWVIARRSRDE